MTNHVRAAQGLLGAAAIAVVALGGGLASAQDAATATSAEDFGGMDGLIAAAQAEGELNVIALPPDWANYGMMIETFAEKYGIKVNSAQPDASSQDEINAANQLRGQDRAPDVFDLGANVALRNTDLFAPYKVATWDDIPDALKDPDGRLGQRLWRLHVDRLRRRQRARADHRGRPAEARIPRQGRAQRQPDPGGGRLPRRDDGVARQWRLGRRHRARRRVLPPAQAGRQLPARRPDAGDDRLGPDPGRHRLGVSATWRRRQALEGKRDWKLVVPEGAAVGAFYVQAINKDAPHPAAARLWQEFLYSDEGQNIWLQGFARPVRLDAMIAGRHGRQGRHRRAARDQGRADLPDPGADRQGAAVPARELGAGGRVTQASGSSAGPLVATAPLADTAAPRGGIGRGLRRWLDYLGILPFAVFVAAVPALADRRCRARRVPRPEGGWTLDQPRPGLAGHLPPDLRRLGRACRPSPRCSAPCFGGLLAWAVSVGRRDGVMRRLVLAGSGTLAQFGGVMLAFAFLADLRLQRPGHPVPAASGSASTPSPGAAGSTSCRGWCWSTPTSRSRSW